MLEIVLVEPEIPMNTGNIARTCAVTGARLHLIRPLGFEITESRVRRAGLDYWPMVDLCYHDCFDDYLAQSGHDNFYLATTKAPRAYSEVDMKSENLALVFGKETAGLPRDILDKYRDRCIRIPMRNSARSLNLSNSVAILCYEALRQQGFSGLENAGSMKEDIT